MKGNNRKLKRISIVIAFLMSAAPTLGGGPAYFQGVGDLSGDLFWSDAYAVSADGTTVVGRSRSDSGWQAFRWQSGVMTGLGDLPGDSFFSEAHAVSADGSVVVGFGQAAGGRRAFRWAEGNMQDLGNLCPVGESSAWGVSHDGSVVIGQAFSCSGGTGSVAFRWTDGVMSGLGDLPGGIYQSNATGVSAEGNVVVGWGYPDVYHEAFLWSDGVMKGLGSLGGPGYPSEAFAVSADGNVVVGISNSPGLGNFAFRWQNGEMISLGDLPGGANLSYAWAVSEDGSIIVGESSSGIGFEATIWDSAHGLRNLRSVLADDLGLNLDGWSLERATGVSADGLTIVGQGRNPLGQIEGWVAHVPEPTTAMILVLGGLFVTGRNRRSDPVSAGS